MDGWTGLIEQRLAQLPCNVALEWPGGRAGRQPADVRLRLHTPRWLASVARGQIGAVADAYVQGQLDIEGSMRPLMAAASRLVGDPVRQRPLAWWQRLLLRYGSACHHRLAQDARQVQFHYDVSDDFYALWLDPRRVYSCAYYAQPELSLAQAQEAKLDHICRKLRLCPGMRLLDIGAGWGGLLLWAAERHGVEAVGITLSKHQAAHLGRLLAERGLSGRVQVHLMDYRELPEDQPFDRIASVGMCEHVGVANLPLYFRKIRRLLKPGGLLLNHGITAGGLHHRGLAAGMGRFIEHHIFPGGELTHVSQVAQRLSEAGLELLDAENLRPHYARTLWDWSDALESRLDEARALVDERTVRAYRLYLAGCAMCFERGWLSLFQLLAARPTDCEADGPMRGAQCEFPFNRSYMYG